MDSLTQIALGAACGEAVLGKKVGNRAMLWGAFAGSLPDFDVLIGNLFMDDMSALAFHRGITHSIFFAVTAPLLLAWLIHRLYSSDYYRTKQYKIFIGLFYLFFALLIGFAANFVSAIFRGEESINWLVVLGTTTVVGGLFYIPWKRYYDRNLSDATASYKDWYWLFFWAIFTHPLLDCCTTYGTQLFQPFNDYRVGFNNISVVDPIYTFPLIVCLFLTARLVRNTKWRKYFNWFGIALSTGYMLFTVFHKHQVNQVFEKSLARENIEYQRYMTSPSIFNNILWSGVAEGDTAFYAGMYSFYDEKPEVAKFITIPKNHHLLKGHENDEDVQTLTWFSNRYYAIHEKEDCSLQYNDLRFGTINPNRYDPKDFVFHFILKEQDGELKASERHRGGTEEENEENSAQASDGLKLLWDRMWGIQPKIKE